MSRKIAIIGNGIAGITCARELRKRDSSVKITVISSESKYFYSRTALMYVFMGHLKMEHTEPYEPWFWEKNRIELIFGHVQQVKTNPQALVLDNGTEIVYDQLVLATGSQPNKFGWKGQDLDGVRGLYSRQDLEYLEKRCSKIKTAVIIGGGLIGVELAEMLVSRGIDVHFLVREKLFWNSVLPEQDSLLISQHIRKHHINLHCQEELEEIIGNEKGEVQKVITKKGKVINCDFVGLTAGVHPNVDFLKNTPIKINKGILVDIYLKSSEENIFAIGDCAEFIEAPEGRKNIEQVWYTGKLMGETLAKTLSGEPTPYAPGHWFNSAKFFDIEYQTYGRVNAILAENELDFYWEHPTEEKAIHIVFGRDNDQFIGINTFGIRMRHHAFNYWLNKQASVEEVLSDLKSANFDPEFYKQYEASIVSAFNQKFSRKIAVKKKNWLNILNFSKA